MLNRSVFENCRAGGISTMEVIAGVEGFSAGQGQRRRKASSAMEGFFVPLQRTDLRGVVDGPLADLVLTQTFGYSREQCDAVLEVVYRFPLPGDAAVTGVTVRFGDVEIVAKLAEREEAETGYKEAVEQGNQAALLTRESPDVFTLQVAGICPDEPVVVETRYVQVARAEGPGWSLRIPLTTAPRYVRSDELTSRHAQGQPLALLRDPGHRFSLDLLIWDAGSVESSTHSLEISGEGGAARVRLAADPEADPAEAGEPTREVLPDRDCVLGWQARRVADRPALAVALHEEEDWIYFLALVAPPAQPPAKRIPREVHSPAGRRRRTRIEQCSPRSSTGAGVPRPLPL